jgi:cold shock CspA family protein
MPRSQASFAKKEKEKKRLEKRKDKEQRREERKANSQKGASLEDMMAYIDENGNITSTPPDPLKKRHIKTDDIVIGARNSGETQAPGFRTGRVLFFNASKGFGFIKDDSSQESIFVHSKSLTFALKDNDKVTFRVEQGHKGLEATSIKKI